MNLAEFIQQARDQKGLTQKQLADQSATLVGYIRWLEDGKLSHPVSAQILARIAAALDVNQSDYICFRTNRWPDDIQSLRATADSERVETAMGIFRQIVGATDSEGGVETILRIHTEAPGPRSHIDTWEYCPYRRTWVRVDCTSDCPCTNPPTCDDPRHLHTFQRNPVIEG